MAGVRRGCPKARRQSWTGCDQSRWVFQYALVDTTGQHSLSELRSFEDWKLRYHLRSVPGVADVAPVGGYTRSTSDLDPNRLQGFGIPILQVVDAVREGNNGNQAA